MGLTRRGFIAGLLAAPALIPAARLDFGVPRLVRPLDVRAAGLGDIFCNTDITGALAWICVVAGSPGTWVPIDPLAGRGHAA